MSVNCIFQNISFGIDKKSPNSATFDLTNPVSCSSADILTSDTDKSNTSAKTKTAKRVKKKVTIDLLLTDFTKTGQYLMP